MLRFGISRIRLGYCVLLCILRSFRVNLCAPQNSVGFEIIVCLLGSVRNLILKTNYSELAAPETRATWNSLMIFK